MDFNKNIFRAYDIRGVYPSELNDEVAYRTARAMAEFYPNLKTFVVASDPRVSSPALLKAVTEGLIDSGKDVINIGMAPDPLFFFTILHYKHDGGIMISGSHNPKEYNGMGLHVIREDGELDSIIEDEMEKVAQRVASDKSFEEKEKGNVSTFEPEKAYIEYVSKRINLKKPLKIVIDSANGACGYLPEKIFKKLGCEVQTLFGEPDGTFPNHLPDPYKEENLVDIKKQVLANGADVGFAFDTDGDRVAPIDNKGRTVTGDFCLLMLSRHTLKKKKGPIAHCMRVSKALLDEMEKEGVKTHFCVSFHEAVRKRILEKNAVFGGEVTYHFLFPIDYYLCDEALFSALKLAEIASKHDDFADYVDSLPRYFASPEVFIDVPDNEKFELVEKLQKYLKENNYNFIDVDGARISFDNGWALARASNTTPFIKCRFEGVTEKDLVEIEKKSLKIFEEVGMPITDKVYKELDLEK